MKVAEPGRTRLAVLGSPIEHSRSPQLHQAAYRVLGLPWSYDRHEVSEGSLAAFIDGLDAQWRGLSLTMPLKPEALRYSASLSDVAQETGAVNTILLSGSAGPAGFNTDVYGITRALRDHGIDRVGHVLVLGAGATARSVVTAIRRMGGRGVTVGARRVEAADAVMGYARDLGLVAHRLDIAAVIASDADLVVNTIPGGAAGALMFDDALRRSALLEIAYNPWPSPLVQRWEGPVVSGLEMLLHQAVAQVRIFATGDPHAALPDESRVLSAMRAALLD